MKDLCGKYVIQKTNGSSIDPDADYFVLRLDTDLHARGAMIAYAVSVQNENPILSKQIREKLEKYWQLDIQKMKETNQ